MRSGSFVLKQGGDMPDKRYIIVNADDFGMNALVNQTIMTSIRKGLVTTTTMLVNLEGFDEACALAADGSMKGRVGLHVNFTEGVPLTDAMKKIRLFCDADGQYVFKKNEKRIFHLDADTRKAVYGEIVAQIRKCRAHGIRITHADAHNHMHEEPGMIPVFIEALKNNGIPYLRRVKDLCFHSKLPKKLFRKLCNGLIERNRLSGADYFATVDEYVSARDRGIVRPGSVTEIMVHPGKIEGGNIIDVCTDQLLNEVIVARLAGEQKIRYSDVLRLVRA